MNATKLDKAIAITERAAAVVATAGMGLGIARIVRDARRASLDVAADESRITKVVRHTGTAATLFSAVCSFAGSVESLMGSTGDSPNDEATSDEQVDTASADVASE